MKSNMNAAAGLTTRVIRIARVLLVQYITLSSRMLGEVDLMVTLMLHSMQPYMGDTDGGAGGDGASATGKGSLNLGNLSHRKFFDPIGKR